ncbi:MAG TPA: quinone-dependent dihydroorotate dehydrogenase [Casimicrobiaceae bacterium]|nr:quinone-dependent dihydroorotate dehydrogenase [Casimicrobiaceae bacterium]
MLYPLFRPLLFALDPETAHDVTLAGLDAAVASGIARLIAPRARPSPVEVMGIVFPNRVGLAAGLDKNAAHIDGLAALGFGFIECGTVTPRAQPGNPKPRLFRVPEADALINRLGFNNEGVERFVANVQRARFGPKSGGILGLNIGRNFDTPNAHAIDDYRACLRRVYEHASYVTVNISSPNTPGLRALQEDAALGELLAGLKTEQTSLAQRYSRYTPLVVKISPDLSPPDLRRMARSLVAHRIDGVIATNTTVERGKLKGIRQAEEAGGLSGRPLMEKSTAVIRALAAQLGGALPIIGVGGIMSGADAKAKIDAGATLVQIYTGLVYRGPELIAEIAEALAPKRPA